MKTTTLVAFAFLVAAAGAGANDFAGYYDAVQSVRLKAKITVTIEQQQPIECQYEYLAAGALYRINLDCVGGDNPLSGSLAFDGQRTRMFQKASTAVQSQAGSPCGAGSAFGVPNPFFVPVAEYLDLSENWQLSDVKDALAGRLVRSHAIVRTDDLRDGFPRHLVLAGPGVHYEYRITELETNKDVPLETFALAPPGTTEVKAEDIEATAAQMAADRKACQPDVHTMTQEELDAIKRMKDAAKAKPPQD